MKMGRATSGLQYPERFYAAASYVGFDGSPRSATKAVRSKFKPDTALLLYALHQQVSLLSFNSDFSISLSPPELCFSRLGCDSICAFSFVMDLVCELGVLSAEFRKIWDLEDLYLGWVRRNENWLRSYWFDEIRGLLLQIGFWSQKFALQATVGACNTAEPSAWNAIEKSKWSRFVGSTILSFSFYVLSSWIGRFSCKNG